MIMIAMFALAAVTPQVGTAQAITKTAPATKPVRFTATGTYADGISRVFLVTADIDSDNDGVSDLYDLRVTCAKGAVVSSIVSPRDASSGLPTGKRMHKPETIRATGGIMASDDWQTRSAGKVIAASWDLAPAKGGRSAASSSGSSVTLSDVDPAVCAGS